MNNKNDNLFLLNSLKVLFEDEILNEVVINENEIIVTLLDGTKAKVTTQSVA